MKGEKVIVSSQHGLRNGKSLLTSLITFYNELSSLVGEGRTVDVVYLDFRKAFDILIEKLRKYRLSGL